MSMNNFMNRMLDFVNFRLGVIAILATLLFVTLLLSISAQAAAVGESSGSGMESTWVLDLIIVKLKGFHWR